jgi:hypothetical protein
MNDVTLVGIDLGKHTFHLHGQDKRGGMMFRKKCTRKQLVDFFSNFPACTVVDPTNSSQGILEALRKKIESLEPYKVTVEGNTLRFETRLFDRMGTYNLLRPISEGRISVDCSTGAAVIEFKLSFEDMVAAVSVMVAVLAIPVFNAPNLDMVGEGLILAAAWLWLFGGNFIVTSIRFPRFIRRCLEQPRQ